jgi:hypothetical protein
MTALEASLLKQLVRKLFNLRGGKRSEEIKQAEVEHTSVTRGTLTILLRAKPIQVSQLRQGKDIIRYFIDATM